jgi:hypothetical protein
VISPANSRAVARIKQARIRFVTSKAKQVAQVPSINRFQVPPFYAASLPASARSASVSAD